MPSGKVKWFNSKKGYGFITLDEDNQKDIFLHVSALEKSKFRIYQLRILVILYIYLVCII